MITIISKNPCYKKEKPLILSMNKIYLKLWIIIPILLTAFLLYSHYKDTKEIKDNAAVDILGVEEQDIDQEDLLIEEVPKEEEKENQVYAVGIPYYWKSGINTEIEDPLEGYVPSIKTFREYYETKNSILLGVSEADREDILKENIILEKGTYIFSDGIKNVSSYFKWDTENCIEMYSTEVESNTFICDNWVNWLGKPLEEKTYVLTRCNINNKEGYCVFEDYLKEYYNLKTTAETRCYGQQNTEYICNYSEYTEIVEYN
jgi:hypothetical protein